MVKTKLKPVLPSLREKKRYLVYEVISKEKIMDTNSVSSAISGCSLHFLGQLGAAKAGIMVLNNKWNPELQRGIIKVSHKYADALKASLAFADNSYMIGRIIRWASWILRVLYDGTIIST